MISLPTDNLYKFIAISGISLLIFCGHLNWNTQQTLLQKLEDIETEVDVLSFQQTTLDNDLKKDKDTTNKQRSNSPIAISQKKQLSNIQNELQIKGILLKGKAKSLRRITNDSKNLFVFTTTIGTIGILMAFFGFFMWYYKVQVHHDRSIKKIH